MTRAPASLYAAGRPMVRSASLLIVSVDRPLGLSQILAACLFDMVAGELKLFVFHLDR